MPYTTPTADQLQAKYPAFAAVDDAVVDLFITDANRSVDTTWTEGDYQTAIMLLACHLMTMAGHGTGGDAQVNAQGLAGFKSIRSGQLSLDRGSAADQPSGYPPQYVGSIYGQQFWNLLKLNKPGGAVTGGTNVAVPAGYYPTYPYPWPWLFP